MKNLVLSLALFSFSFVCFGSAATPRRSVKSTFLAPTIDQCVTDFKKVVSGDYDVLISFSGISVFDRQDAMGYISVRMPNAASGRAPIADPQHPGVPLRNSVPPHISYILTDDVTAAQIDADLLQPTYFEGSCYSYYPMKGDRVTVSGTSVPKSLNNNPLCFTDAATVNEYCPNDGSKGGKKTEGSMRWIPSIKTITGSDQPKHAAHFDDLPDPNWLAGVIKIDRGYLETAVMDPGIWAFRNSASDPTEYTPQTIAQEVRWHMHGKGTTFVLHVERKNGRKFDLTFKPVNDLVRLFIASSPVDETGPIRKASSLSYDDHFRLYYEFIDKFAVETGRIPFSAANPVDPYCDLDTFNKAHPTLTPCDLCPDDPYCKMGASPRMAAHAHGAGQGGGPGEGDPLPSGLGCGPTDWP